MDCILIPAEHYISTPNDINVHYCALHEDNEWHKHDFIEIAYVLSGKGAHEIEGEITPISRGDIFFINTGTPHRYHNDDKFPLVICNCIFLPSVLTREFSSGEHFIGVAYRYLFSSPFEDAPGAQTHICLHETSGAIASILDEMHEEYSEKRNGYRQIMKADLHRLLIRLFRLSREEHPSAQDNTVYPNLVVQSAIAYMKNRCEQDIRCEDLAAHTYVSPSYLARVFKQITGKTVIRVLQEIRMEKSCKLLRETDLAIYEIATRCGYTDMKYFYSLFTRIVGKTPGAYRNEKRP